MPRRRNEPNTSEPNTRVEAPAIPVDEVLAGLLEYKPKSGQKLWPWLVGPTGSGKTTRVHEYARRRGLPVIAVHLHSMLTEEILGIPEIRDNRTIWTLPDWATDRPAIIFFDEVDKAPMERLGVVMTTLAELRVRNRPLHPDTLMILASQPVDPGWVEDETGAAIRARTVPLAVSYDWQRLEQMFPPINLGFLPADVPQIPALPKPSARQVEYCLGVLYGPFSEEHAKLITHSVLGTTWAERLLQQMEQVINPENVVKGLLQRPERTKTMPTAVLSKIMDKVLIHGNGQLLHDTFVRVIAESSPDAAQEAIKQMLSRARDAVLAAGGEMQFLQGEPDFDQDKWLNLVNSIAAELGSRWSGQPIQPRKLKSASTQEGHP